MNRLKDKATLITGAGSGIGRATALRFAAEGALVAVADINVEAANTVTREIEAAGGRAITIGVDLRAIEAFGRIDVLFNNAVNTAAGRKKRDVDFLEFDREVFYEIIDVNVLGGVLASKFAIPHMLRQGGGCILFTSSTSSLGGDVAQFSYGASKAMINWYVKTLATTFGKQGIRCNAILPGVIETPAMQAWASPEMQQAFLDLQNVPRLGRPEDIASLAVFLASDEAAFANGAHYLMDGGMTCSLPFAGLQRKFFLSKR